MFGSFIQQTKCFNPISGFPFLKLNELRLSENRMSGPVPECIRFLTSLRNLYLDSNNLNSTIPSFLWSLTDILEVNLSSNGFVGSLPAKISGMNALIKLDISNNHLSGKLPIGIGGLQKIVNLSLANNLLQGPIPYSVGNMLSLEFLDLSHNFLSSIIPESIEKLLYQKSINLSYNKLEGEIPYGGSLANFTAQSFIMNEALCGRPELEVQLCPGNGAKHSRTGKNILLTLAIPVTVSGIFLGYAIFLIYQKKCNKGSRNTDLRTLLTTSRIPYHELVEATHKFDERSLVGSGSFGSVYKGKLSNGLMVAIEVFHLDNEQEASRSFDKECEALHNLCHRNLVKVMVMEFGPNGSLDKWLYFHNYFLSFMQRINIGIDIAPALEYLHHGNPNSVVHCDLNPSNVLLDEDIAHVCDLSYQNS